MKVGTDGVLLGAWAGVRPSDRRILDIGTGTGLIALMLAQRAPAAQVTGIDIEEVGQACENAAASLWSDRVTFVQGPVQTFAPGMRFDLIVSNPPFFVDSLTSPDAGRTTARHAVRLSFEELRDAVARLLAPGGRFALILPTTEAERFAGLCRGVFALRRRTDVRTTPRRAPKRAMLEFEAPPVSAEGFESELFGTCSPEQKASPAAPAFSGPASPAFPAAPALSGPCPASPASPAAPVLSGPCPVSRVSSAAPVLSGPVPAAPASPPAAALFADSLPVHDELVIGTGRHEEFTPEYRALTRDFYLKF